MPSTPQAATLDGLFVDERDDTRLFVRVTTCVQSVDTSIVEDLNTIEIDVEPGPGGSPCERIFEVRLDSPLGTRVVTDTAGSALPVAAADFLYPDPAREAPAGCDQGEPAEAVLRNVDGGLRTHVLHCDADWLAVATSTNACPAGEDDPNRDGCLANAHTAYFHNIDGYWVLLSIDQCQLASSYRPDVPPTVCQD